MTADGTYPDLLRAAQGHLRPSTYVEVGTHEGDSLVLARPPTIAVGIDPAPTVRHPLPAATTVLEATSDEALAAGDGRLDELRGGRAVDLAFVDGLHLFEVALRDVIGLERRCHPGSPLLLHDTLPDDAEMAARERSTVRWSGDVWKLVLCLREERPELRVATLDTPPAGLTVVRGLDPGSDVLARRYDDLCERWVPMGFDALCEPATQLGLVPGDERSLLRLLDARPEISRPVRPAAR
ncbi:class I SAM-dependent methyltransferase [soil metagenome]